MERLYASGTNDPLIAQRIGILNAIKASVDNTIMGLDSGNIKPEDVAIKSADIDRALIEIGNNNQISTEVQGAFFSNNADPQLQAMVQQTLNRYIGDIIDGSSFNIQYNYISPRQLAVHVADALASFNDAPRRTAAGSTIGDTGFPNENDLAAVTGTNHVDSFESYSAPAPFAEAPRPMDRRAVAVVGSTAAHFDWKDRAAQITAQIKKRGLNPEDFGVMPAGTKVSDDFGWRGYVRMICTRLQATPDAGLPETCGCPPLDWAGWRTFN
jgi:hypothetical protein